MACGDADAMAAFVRRFQVRVYGLARAVVDDPGLAEEVAQDGVHARLAARRQL
jgi:DNA-directed RNA polymerase specialized sigma24 family protein